MTVTNLKQMLEEITKQHGGKTAIVSGERRLSYTELDEASNKLANALIKMGVKRGDRVVILLPDTPDWIIVYFGVVKSGGTTVRLNPRSKVEEAASFIDDCQPKVLVTESSVLETLMPALPGFKSIEKVIDLSSKYHEGQFVSYQEIMTTSPSQQVKTEPEPGDTADIAYTSGTTGVPKGIVLSHQTFVKGVTVVANGFRLTDKDIIMMFALPLYHMFALVVDLLLPFYKGSTIVIVPGLSIASLTEAIEKEKGTIMVAVPAIYALAIETAEKEGVKNDISSVRLFGSAGAPLPIESRKRFNKHYGTDITEFYGTSETPTIFTLQPLDGTGKFGSVGKIQPGVELKIADEEGKELPSNQAGEIILRGCLLDSYYKNPQATAEVIKDGWYYTGDIGKIDDDGYVFILGRKKDMIIVSGHNVYPVDVEDVLHTHPKVAEAAIIGIPDKTRGEAIKAFISLKKGEVATEAEIKKFCRERLVDYKVPREVVIMDSLPKTSTGKIRKQSLRG
jgi:long-chain acyl-CoA synthetase